MGNDFVQNSKAARDLFEQADAILGLPLSKLCFEGPLEELTATDIAQPAIFTCSLAAIAALEEQAGSKIEPVMTAGLSLGEYTALVAAGVISFDDGLRLVRLRGAAMQAASEAMPSGMTSVMAMEREPLEDLCKQVAADSGAICQVANLNSPGQLVVSGQDEALDLLESRAKDAGAKRAIRLNVAGAFHSEVMRPASEKLETALAEIEFKPAACPVWQNATAESSTQADTLKANLVAQLCAPVLWQESFAKMAASAPATTFLEPAPGRVLSALARKIARDAKVITLHEAAAINDILETN